MKKLFIFSFLVLCVQTKYIAAENISLTFRCDEMSILGYIKHLAIVVSAHSGDIECRITTKKQGELRLHANSDSICKILMKPHDELLLCIIEKIKDTAFAREMYEGAYNYTVSDIAIEMVADILESKYNFNVRNLFHREFSKETRGGAHSTNYEILHHYVFIKNTPEENYKNRIIFYNAVKKFYEEEKKKK